VYHARGACFKHKRLMQLAHIRGKSRVNKTWRLFHVDLFGKDSTEEDIMDIELMNLPTTQNRN
jgi:hypothetical protein